MRYRRVIIAAALLVLVATAVVLAAELDEDQEASTGPKNVRLVDMNADGERLWPYTSRHADFRSRTLAINVIVYDDPEIVRYRLERRSNATWSELNESEETANFSVELSEERVGFDWSSAHGAMRYTYVQRDGQGRWLPQRYQLHAGTYLGTRSHVRVYAPGGDSEWSAIQAHSEYWDWFRLRHGVTDVWKTGRDLEEDFADQPLVTDVERAFATDRGPMSDGISVVHVAWALLAVSMPAVRRRVAAVAGEVGLATQTRRRSVALFGFALAIPLVVRGAGIGLEQALPWLTPKLIAAPLYVVLVAGLPVGVYRLSEAVPAERAIALAGIGFLVGVTLDAIALELTGVLARYAWHRLTLAVALGAIAGGSREAGPPRKLLVAGFCLWSGGVLAAALDLV